MRWIFPVPGNFYLFTIYIFTYIIYKENDGEIHVNYIIVSSKVIPGTTLLYKTITIIFGWTVCTPQAIKDANLTR